MSEAEIRVARAYDEAAEDGSARLLVDRVWPRGISRENLRLDDWIREVAPSGDLRKWFGHEPIRWEEFCKCYCAELDDNPAAVARCLDWCRKGTVTLLFAARDRDHNQAVVLRAYLAQQLEPDRGR